MQMQIQTCKCKYNYEKTNMQIQIDKYMFIPRPTSKTGGFKIGGQLAFPLVSPVLEPNLHLEAFLISCHLHWIHCQVAPLCKI